MENKKVALVRCNAYDYAQAEQAIRQALSLIEFDLNIFAGKTVLVKPNLLIKAVPDRCATTHPTLIGAMARLIGEHGGKALIGDSPGGPMGNNRIEGVYAASGMADAAQYAEAELVRDLGEEKRYYPEARVLKQMNLLKVLSEVDMIVDMAKMKTHGLTGYTGAVKNLYGCVPGMSKVEYHYRMPDLESFSNMLVDLCEYIKPVLSIIDAVQAMEGAGPSGGTPRYVGAIIASTSPYAADTAAIRLMNVQPQDICTVQRSIERGWLQPDLDDVELCGVDIDTLVVKDFKYIPANNGGSVDMFRFLPKSMSKALTNWLQPKLKFDPERCKACRDCERSCPMHAIHMENKLPVVDNEKCIRCFCCHELCPYQAIEIKRPWILRLK